MVRKLFHITEQQLRKLQELSDETGLSVAEHIRRAVDLYLKQLENDRRINR